MKSTLNQFNVHTAYTLKLFSKVLPQPNKCPSTYYKFKKYFNLADGAANAANQPSRPEVPTRNLIRPFTLNLRQRASHQSTGSISSINSPNTPPATNGE